MQGYSLSTKVSHQFNSGGHFNRLPDNAKLNRELLIRRKRREDPRSKESSFHQGALRVVLRLRKFTRSQVM